MKGSSWTLLSFALTRLLGFATTIILARLLSPEDFGVLAIATLIVVGLQIVSDLGLIGILVTRYETEPHIERVVFGAYLALSAGTALLTMLVGLAAWPFVEATVSELVMLVGLIVLTSGPVWFLGPFLRVRLRFRAMFAAQTILAISQFAATLLMAFAGVGVWSVLWGQIVGSVAGTAAHLYFCARTGGIPRPLLDIIGILRVVREGFGFFAQSIVAFISQNVDNMIVGWILGARSLGLYSASYKLAEVPYQAIVGPVSQVTFVRFSRLHARKGEVEAGFLTSHRILCFVCTPACAVFIAVPSLFLNVVYGSTWLAAAPILATLGIWSFVRVPQTSLGYLLNSTGYPGLMAKFSSLMLFIDIPALVVGAYFFGTVGAAVIMVTSVIASYLYMLSIVRRRLTWSVRPILRIIAVNGLSCTIAVIAMRATEAVAAGLHPWLLLGVCVVACLAVQAVIVLALDGALRQLVRSLLGSVRHAGRPAKVSVS